MKRKAHLKTIALIVVLVIVNVSMFDLFAQDAFGTMVGKLKDQNANIKTAVTWIGGILELVGAVIVGSKLLSGKPDAKDGLVNWIGGMIFIGLAIAAVYATM